MITLFATPKNFNGIFKNIQLNALRSWRALSPDIQIIIFGDSKGSKDASQKINAEYIPNVKCSPQGTPYLSDLFQQADNLARFSIMTFINADIILPKNFLEVAINVSQNFKKFLMVGHRLDMDVNSIIDFKNSENNKYFWQLVDKQSIRHAPSGIDYFVYNKNLWGNLPDFIIGRPGYDNWLIWKARRRLIPITDATESVKAVHQNHHFNFHNITDDPKIVHESEGNFNRKLVKKKSLNILDSTHQISNGNIVKKNDKNSRQRYWHRLPIIFPECAIPIKLIRRLIINRIV